MNTPASHNAYLVHIRTKDGYAAQAGLVQGDLVIGMTVAAPQHEGHIRFDVGNDFGDGSLGIGIHIEVH